VAALGGALRVHHKGVNAWSAGMEYCSILGHATGGAVSRGQTKWIIGIVLVAAIMSGAACRDAVTSPSKSRELQPRAMFDDSTCYSFGNGHPCTLNGDDALITAMESEAFRLQNLDDPTCQSLGVNMQALVNRGGQSIRVWNATWFPPEGNGAPAEGDWHDAMPNEIHLWGNLTDGELLRTARHETTHYMRRDSFDNGDFGSGDPSGYNPDDPSTVFNNPGNPQDMGAYALSDYCGGAS